MFGDRIKPTKRSEDKQMPLNDDPHAIPDSQYYAEMQALADQVGDAGLHVIPAEYLPADEAEEAP